MAKLRIGLTISGAVSLGAYEGGALAALLLAVQRMQGAVIVDAITGASAGAMTAVLAARCLLRGSDPVEAMKRAWVDLPSLKRLASRDLGSPLSSRVLQEAAEELLGDAAGSLPEGGLRQDEAIAVAITLASLGGFEYLIGDVQKRTAVRGVTHLDWAEFTFTADSPAEEWGRAAQAALASGANAVGFPPKLLRRTPDDQNKARENGILNPPGPDGAWYTDGGTINNEPFGRILDLISDDEHDDRRLLLLVHPHPSTTPPKDLWTDATLTPRWTRTGLRAKKLQGVQSIYDDLRRLEKTNTRLQAVDKLVERLEGAVSQTSADADPAVAGRLRGALVSALREALDDQHHEKQALNEMIGRKPPSPEEVSDDSQLGELLGRAIRRATGLAGKHPASVEIVSPALDPNGKSAEELLAGERLGHFMGFLADRFRQNDFALGYDHMRIFLRDTLPDYDLQQEVVAVLPDVDARYNELDWSQIQEGDATFKALRWAEKARFARLGGWVALIIQNDVRKWNKGVPVKP